MSKVICNLYIGSTVLSLMLALANSAIGADVFKTSRISRYTSYQQSDRAIWDGTIQVTPVSQLMDVKPRDWSFQALKSLIERYGIVVDGFNSTFQGDRSLTYSRLLKPQ